MRQAAHCYYKPNLAQNTISNGLCLSCATIGNMPILANPVRFAELVKQSPLNGAEEKFKKCMERGEPCILGNSRVPDKGDDTNTIRADLIRFFACGGDQNIQTRGGIIELQGAWVPEKLDLSRADIQYAMAFPLCHFDSNVRMEQAKCPALYFDGAHLEKGFEGEGMQIKGDLRFCQKLYLVVRSKRERTSASRGFLTKAQIAFYLHALSLKSLFQVGTVKVKCRAFCLLHPYITVKVAQGKRHSILNICTRQIQFFRHPRPLQFNNTASGLDVLVAATSKKTNQVGADGIGVIALIRDSAVSQYARLASLHAFLKFFLRAVQWALLHQFGEADRICEDGHVADCSTRQAQTVADCVLCEIWFIIAMCGLPHSVKQQGESQ